MFQYARSELRNVALKGFKQDPVDVYSLKYKDK